MQYMTRPVPLLGLWWTTVPRTTYVMEYLLMNSLCLYPVRPNSIARLKRLLYAEGEKKPPIRRWGPPTALEYIKRALPYVDRARLYV